MKKINILLILVLFSVFLSSCSDNSDPGLLFERGKYEEAYNLWLPQAEQGDREAQNYLGVQYYLGLGVEKNYREAIQWYEKAALAGLPDAQRNLGDMYHYGRGVPRDFYKAFIWYFAASQQGHVTAGRSLENITGKNQLTPNQQMHAKIEANRYITDPALRFQSHDTYVDK